MTRIARSNKPRSEGKRKDGELTRARIYQTALALFRDRGFDAATMRDIARAAGVSLGAAYHYFPSKEAIVLAFYRAHLTQHDEVARKLLTTSHTLRDRLEAVFASGLDVRGADRPLLATLARTALDVHNPISVFSNEARDLRTLSIALFRDAVETPEVDPSLREALGLSLWALQLGLLLRFVYDESPLQKQTRALMKGALDLVPPITMLMSSPFGTPMRDQLLALLRDGGLLSADQDHVA